jgi:phosphopantothenoylcysteine decarboxylase/phosphopantothenate--cysteine ligase
MDVESAKAMHRAVMQTVPDAQIFIACAAVADYRPQSPSTSKLKKTRDTLTLKLVRNPDIAADVAARDPAPFVLGFAAETEDLQRHARAKLQAKGFDMIAANRVGEPGLGFEAGHNALEVYWPGGHRSLARTDKALLARQLIQLMAKRYAAHQDRVISIHGPHRRGQGPG